MSTTAEGKTGWRLWSQELKSNRRTQAALVLLAFLLGWLFWPEQPVRRAAAAPASRFALAAPLEDRLLEKIGQLPDLIQLDRAGELPKDGRMYRDPFLFDMPPPPPPPPPKPVPPPPPPTPEELVAMQLAQARQEATNSRPQNLRYLGYMSRPSSGRIGAFIRGEEVISLREGDVLSSSWRLVTLSEIHAEFQNLKFQDIRYRIESKDQQSIPSAAPTNQF